MITGDQALSSANRDEINALTLNENKEGKLIKVVIVTLAGSEGIDLKCIRQVHIIDPWYNIFRIEQLIGRAVRTCSHKTLPFKKRNVQIFLYVTYSDDDIENADLNLYRRSYAKMIKIGKISRVIKEHAIDCQLNIKQTNFSVDTFNQTVSIELSTAGNPTIDYQVGDKQFSHLCDYMSDCEYTCKPNAEVGEVTTEIKLPFLVLNVDKIVERIKELFYEYISFEKSQLIKLIQIQRTYPIEQINLALDKLITDETEFLTNGNGTVGRLVNVGTFYRFQPLELMHSNVTHFDVSRPIDFKPPGKYYDMDSKKVDDTSVFIPELDNNTKLEELLTKLNIHYNTLQLNIDYRNTKTNISKLDWYSQASIVIHNLISKFPDIEIQFLHKLGIHHFIEELSLEQHIVLLQYLDKTKEPLEVSIIVKEYYKKREFLFNDNKYILLYNEQTDSLVVLIYEDEWKVYDDIVGDIIPERANSDEVKIRIGDYASIVGFLYYHPSKQEYILKLISGGEMGKKNIGFWCKDKKEASRKAYLNTLLRIGNLEDNIELSKVKTCILLEILLRIYQNTKLLENGMVKQWFLDPVTLYLQRKSTIK